MRILEPDLHFQMECESVLRSPQADNRITFEHIVWNGKPDHVRVKIQNSTQEVTHVLPHNKWAVWVSVIHTNKHTIKWDTITLPTVLGDLLSWVDRGYTR